MNMDMDFRPLIIILLISGYAIGKILELLFEHVKITF